ncbi:MAG: glycine cleavage system aminomethyltransferase T [Candidatus Azotimanducaceae bacterium]
MGLGKFCDTHQEANFVGKEALTKIRSEGVRQKLMGAEIDGIPIDVNEHHWPVSVFDIVFENVATSKLESDISNVPVGKLTSCVYSSSLGKNIAYIMVPIEYAEIGQKLCVQSPCGPLVATLCPLPFVKNRAV